MTDRLTPSDEREIAAAIGDAAGRRRPLSIAGGTTRGGLGRPLQTAATLSTEKLSGVTLYEPSELVISARAGTPLATVESLLAESNQRLPFEPMDHRPLLGSEGEPTIGGVVAANVSGPRRIQAGAARDSLIGIRAVAGRGEIVKSGGRVMKNVTGYDLARFIAGSYGTLAVLSEVTFKVQPIPEVETTLVLSGVADRRAVEALSAALTSPFSVSGAAHLPGAAQTLIRLEGFAASVEDRATRLAAELADFGSVERLDGEASVEAWRKVRDVQALDSGERPVWRISTRPINGPKLVEAVRNAFDCAALYDWGGGLVWLTGNEGDDAGAAAIRAALRPLGGHATLIRAPEDIRNSVEVFQPLDAGVMALTRKLKQSLDPAGILNPGRMVAGL